MTLPKGFGGLSNRQYDADGGTYYGHGRFPPRKDEDERPCIECGHNKGLHKSNFFGVGKCKICLCPKYKPDPNFNKLPKY